MGSSSSKDDVTMESEDDEEREYAKVYILKTALGIGGSMSLVNHWALVFEFESGRYPWVTIEGVGRDGVLCPGYKSRSSKPSGTLIDPQDPLNIVLSSMTYNFKTLIASKKLPKRVYMSPKEVYNVAMNNDLNYKPYIVGINDCQSWVISAAGDLEED
ncbi:hypothetical protein B566_EDAN001327 [Ephemera danica]|nr:hypothetical protein B566_EDAN001327 [Ephemera danica]